MNSRSLTVIAVLIGLAIVVGIPYFLGTMNLSSPYNDTTTVHKGDEGWPVIPAAAIMFLAVVLAVLNIRRKQSQIDKVMYDERNVVSNENHGPHSGLGHRSARVRHKNFQYPA